MYGAVPPVADTVTEVVPPKQLITGAVDEAVGKELTTIVPVALTVPQPPLSGIE